MKRRPLAVPQLVPTAGKVPPSDLNAEAAVLSACMLDARVVPEVRAVIPDPHMFYSEANRAIYEAILGVDTAGSEPDVTTVAAWLRDREKIQAIGGAPYLAQIVDATPAVLHVEDHAKVVAGHFRRRRVIAECQLAAAEGYGDVGELDAWCADVAGRVADAADSSQTEETLFSAAEAAQMAWAVLTSPKAQGGWIPTGFKRLDRKLGGGFRRKNQYTIAGRPGHGKTACALGAALNIAEAGQLVVFISVEMPLEDLVPRAWAQIERIDAERLVSGNLKGEDWNAAARAAKRFGELPLHIDARAPQTIQGIRTSVRRALAKARKERPDIELGAVFVDYIQLLSPEGGDTREQEISLMSRSLAHMAKEFDCAVVTLSQLNRNAAKTPGEYRLSDLRESGSIEQDSFGVVFVHRNDQDEQDESKHDKTGSFIVGKCRQYGKTGSVPMYFEGPCMRFFDVTDEWDEGWEERYP